ncbi:hypothetical protein LX36DRAFT_751750 [Colletotrichum falcatum]|nr:hypothetical protein LX36DRAFT_751750 [Colletotrichum falcatum]
MPCKEESPESKRLMEDAAETTTTRESTATSEPDSKRRRIERSDPEPDFVLDVDGDLSLCVGAARVSQPTTFLVCSKSISRSSPVMKQMILGEPTETLSIQDDRTNRTIHLPDDEPVPMRLMLEVIHGDFRHVPQKMEIQALHALVVVMHKYDALSLVRPWVRAWLASARTSGDYARLFSITWALGDVAFFSTTSSRLIEYSHINPQHKLVSKEHLSLRRTRGPVIAEETAPLIPASMIGKIEIERVQRISAEVAPYIKLYEELKRGNCECRSATPNFRKSMSPRCRVLALGSLVQGFLDLGINITNPNPTSAYKGSLISLMCGINSLEILTDRNCGIYNHDECARMQETLKFKRALGRSFKPLTDIVPGCREHLASQAEKTGLSA